MYGPLTVKFDNNKQAKDPYQNKKKKKKLYKTKVAVWYNKMCGKS
jgi:hypothetical protein